MVVYMEFVFEMCTWIVVLIGWTEQIFSSKYCLPFLSDFDTLMILFNTTLAPNSP